MNTQDQNATPASPRRELDTFNNPNPGSDYSIRIRIPEFTCLCPKTGQPDFATLYLDYIPEDRCVELKSLKLYIWSYRDTGAFHEAVAHEILNDVVAAIAPRWARLTARFNVRGGIYTTVIAGHQAEGWEPARPDTLPPPVPDPAYEA
jgi:7-cyano-7-deazaguanine reductase